MNPFNIRPTTVEDAPQILSFIKKLAAYEKLEHEVVATCQDIEETLFGPHPTAYALMLEENKIPIGFALYFHNYSTFLCRPGIYIEDIYVEPAFRGKGYGKAVFKYLADMAEENNYGRIEWWCLDWNKPSIDFYTEKLGAEPMKDWTVFRLDQKAIKKLRLGE